MNIFGIECTKQDTHAMSEDKASRGMMKELKVSDQAYSNANDLFSPNEPTTNDYTKGNDGLPSLRISLMYLLSSHIIGTG